MAAATLDVRAAGGKKRKRAAAPSLADLHDDMLEGVLARLPPASYFRLRAVSRRWRAAAESRTFRAACARVTARDPWFLMLQDPDHDHQDQDEDQRRPRPAAAVFDSAERSWARWRGAPPGPLLQPVAAAGGLVLYRDRRTGDLTVVNPLTGASRVLPPPPTPTRALQAVAMYGSPYRVVLILGELPDLSTVVYDSSTDAWGDEAALSRRKPPPAEEEGEEERVAEADGGDDDTGVYFLSKSGDVVATTMQRSASRQYSSAVACRGDGGDDGDAVVVYFLSRSGTVVACDLARRAFAELPRILPAYHEYSIDVVACGGAAYAVVLSEFLDAASLRVWEFAGGGAWRQVAAMPPAMSHAFRGAKADVNCVGHGGRVMVCVSSGGGVGGCFMCDVRTNRWEELPLRAAGDGDGDGDGDDAATGFVAALSFEPRMEAAVSFGRASPAISETVWSRFLLNGVK